MFKNFILFQLVLLFTINTVSAQAPATTQRDYIHNNMFWGNLVINGKIKGKFNYQCDFEERRQADPAHSPEPNATVGTNHANIFKNPYQNAIRPWIHYQPNKFLRFSISPITWFGTWSYPINDKTYFQPEFRTAFQITTNQFLGRVILNYRFRYEFRFYGVKTETHHPGDITGPGASYDFPEANQRGRFRYMVRAIVPFNNKELVKGTFYSLTSCEAFLNVGKNMKNANIFDQTRTYIGVGWKFAKEIRCEAGYLNQMAFRLNNTAKNNVDLNNCLFVNLIFDDLNSFFRKKKIE